MAQPPASGMERSLSVGVRDIVQSRTVTNPTDFTLELATVRHLQRTGDRIARVALHG